MSTTQAPPVHDACGLRHEPEHRCPDGREEGPTAASITITPVAEGDARSITWRRHTPAAPTTPEWECGAIDGDHPGHFVCGRPRGHKGMHRRRTPLPAEPLDEAVASMPDNEWALMLGYEKYDPIPGSPGDLNHPDLAGKMIWWASARRSDPEPGVPLIIVSAERHDSPDAALRDLAGQMRRRFGLPGQRGEG